MAKKKAAEERPLDTFTPMYVALMILLMAFFIVLNSMAVPSEVKRRKALASLIGTFGVEKGRNMMRIISTSDSPEDVEKVVRHQMDELGRKYVPRIMERIKELAMAEYIDFSVTGHNIEITIDSKVMFPPGETKINPEIYPILDSIAEKILEEDCPVIVEGHTDSKPIKSPLIRNNWELSSFRATAISEYLIKKHRISTYKIAAFGFADSKPIVPNDSPENREKNRRVQIILIKTGAMTQARGLKSWWERVGLVNPFDHVSKE